MDGQDGGYHGEFHYCPRFARARGLNNATGLLPSDSPPHRLGRLGGRTRLHFQLLATSGTRICAKTGPRISTNSGATNLHEGGG